MNEKILIIDGHPVYIFKLEGFLRGLTYQNIVLAHSGEEGIQKAESEEPDLVILSGMLPEIDSYEVCKNLKEKIPSTKIIILIGLFTEKDVVAKFHEMGADAILARKEKDLLPLQEAIHQLINKPQSLPFS